MKKVKCFLSIFVVLGAVFIIVGQKSNEVAFLKRLARNFKDIGMYWREQGHPYLHTNYSLLAVDFKERAKDIEKSIEKSPHSDSDKKHS